MYAMWITAVYELKQYFRDTSFLLISLGLPLLLIFILGNALDMEIKPAKVVIYMDDQGELREGIEQFWAEPSLSTYIKLLDADSAQEVESKVKDGKADYGVIVPANFSELVMSGKTAEWTVFPGRNEEKNLAAETVIDKYLSAINLKLATIAITGPDAAQYTSAYSETDQSTSNQTSLVKVGSLGAGSSQVFDSVSAIQYYSAANLILFLLTNGMIAANAVLEQRRKGTLQRLYAAPVSIRAIIAGIICSAFIMSIIQAAVIILFTTYVYNVKWGDHYGLIVLICLLTIIASIGLAFIIASFKLTRKMINTIFTVIVFSMTFISGGMIAGVGGLLSGADRFTLNYWSNASLRSIMNGSDTATIIGEITVLAVVALTLATLAALRLPKVVNYNG